ncbi:MAG TPA: TlpA disulfide reductase family protein [Conexibacter sp.]|nr:TlpA disulfide reductase family protein [Conexibacter sp.]
MRGWGASWIAVAAGLAILVYITYNSVTTPGTSSRGLAAGARMPPFAAPLVTSDLEGDANVARQEGQGAAGARPACEVTDPRALNSCTLTRRGPVVLAFLTESADRCVEALDTLEEVASRHPDVGFAAVAIRGDRGELRELVREHGWELPLAQDRDGAVANIYGVAVCPTVVLARRGGVVLRTDIGEQATTPQALERSVRELERTPPASATTSEARP